jgi:hypothetical protein
MHICHKNDPSTLFLCDDLSCEDHGNVPNRQEIGGSGHRAYLVLAIEVEAQRIQTIRIVVNPEKLARV